jgi:integrase
MATIMKRRRSDGQVRYQATVRKQGFSSVSKTFSRKRDAEQWSRKMESDFTMGEISQGSLVYSISDLFDRYRTDKLPILKSSRCRERHLEWWEERIGDVRLAKLRRSQIKDYLRELSAGDRSGATINRYRATLQAVLSYGVSDLEWIRTNPLQGMAKQHESRGRVRFLTDDERGRLFEQCKGHDDLYLIVLIALTTGARSGEIMALRWSDIDLQERTLHIRNSKNQEPRVLPISESVLKELKKRTRRIGTDDWLFPGKSLGKARMGFPRNAWDERVKRAGLADFRFHDLRHTAASYLAQRGVSTRQLADILGHKTMAMVQRYSHLTVDSRRELVDMLDAKVKN